MSQQDPATKHDVEEIVNRVVTEVVGEVAGEILTVMAERFEQVDGLLDRVENRLTRIENTLRPTIDQVDDHERRLKLLEATPAQANRLHIAPRRARLLT